MRREKWILKVRNTISRLSGECDSAAAIEGAQMTERERSELQGKLISALEWIDDRI